MKQFTRMYNSLSTKNALKYKEKKERKRKRSRRKKWQNKFVTRVHYIGHISTHLPLFYILLYVEHECAVTEVCLYGLEWSLHANCRIQISLLIKIKNKLLDSWDKIEEEDKRDVENGQKNIFPRTPTHRNLKN